MTPPDRETEGRRDARQSDKGQTDARHDPMPLRILVYCDDHGMGGAAQATHRLALGLAGRGHAVTYVQTVAETPWVAERQAAGIARVDLPYDTIKHFTAVMDERRTPARILTEQRPDLVIFADSLMESTLGAKEAAAFLTIPYLIVKHLVLAEALYTSRPALRARVQAAIAQSAGVVTVSAQNRDLMLAQFPEEGAKFSVIRNSVPDAFFVLPDALRREAFRRRFAIPDEAVVVLTVAAVNQRKGFQYQAHLIKALKAADRLTPFVFVWAGVPDQDFFRALWQDLEAAGCADHVRAIGFQSDVGGCLDGSDVLMLPSQQEGMPLVLLEAMAKGIPVIASAVGGSPEAVGDAGVLVHDPNDDPGRMIREIAGVLLRWSEDPAERRRVGEAGRRRASAEFRAAGMIERYEDAVRRSAFGPDDYVSPGLPLVKPDWAFPFRIPADGGSAHPRCRDSRFPRLPAQMLDRDEAHILYATARWFPADACAVEVGCSIGWVAVHLLAAGLRVDVMDPLAGYGDIRNAIMACLPPGADGRVRILAGPAAEMLPAAAPQRGTRWSLIVVDSQRDLPDPSRRTDLPWERYADDDAVIVFTGLDAPEPAACLRRLKEAGWHTRVYLTSGLLGMAWRGQVVPVDHVPDPAVAWPRPAHLAGLGLPPAPLPASLPAPPSIGQASIEQVGGDAR